MKQGGARLKKKNSKTGRFLTRGLAGCAAFVTAYMLVLPAITKSVHLSGELDGLDVRVETNDNVLPVDTQLQLERVWLPDEEPTDDVSHRLTEDETERILTAALGGSEEYEAKILKAVDISLNYNGNEIEPEDQVRLFLKSDLIREAEQPVVVHLTNSGEAELLEARTTEDGEAMIQFGAFDEEEPAVSDGDAGETDAVSDGTDGETGETLDSDAENTDETLGSDAKDTEETLDGDTDETAKISGSDTGEAADVPDGNADETAKAPGSDTGEAADVSGGDASGVSGGSEDAADGSDEISVTTDGFSVYAIVDLLPREGQDLEFTDSVGGMDVCVTAPYTAFPEGTTMEVSLVENENVIDNVSETVQGEFDVLRAVDITFYNAEGEVIEPAEPISVVIKLQEALDAEKSKLIHIGANETSVMDNATFEEGQVQFDSDEFSTYVIIITLGEPGEQVYHGDGVTITVTYGADANLPKGTEMTVRELEEGTEEYDEYFERTREALNLEGDEVPEENVTVADQLNALLSGGYWLESARIFDIELNYQGEKVEPAAPVNVTIEYDEPVALAAEEDSESEFKIVHFADEGTEIISDVTVEGSAISYQQESFSVTAATIAGNYGNAGWFNNGRMEIHYGRVKEDGVPIFELAYLDGKLPGDTGFPVEADSAKFKPGTTIEEIINALQNSVYKDQFFQYCTVVDFMMHDTYVVDDNNRQHNGYVAGTSEEWSGPQKGEKTISIKITRNGGFTGPLLKVNTIQNFPMHMYSGVIIDNAANQIPNNKSAFDPNADASVNAENFICSEPVAVVIEGKGLVMMMGNSHITDSLVSGFGTGIKLINGGSVELFHQSYIERMAVGIEQINGKTRLKDSTNPLGGRNTVGVALHPGQSIGKWIERIDYDEFKAVPVFLRNVESWKSGDIVMDSGYIAVNNQSVKVNVVGNDKGKLIFENGNHGQHTTTRMGLEYFEGSKKGPYPVIRFYVGTVLNTRTGEWYATLGEAVKGENPVHLESESRPSITIQDGDTLVFYGDTVEGQNVEINYNLTIRSSYSGELATDDRSGNPCTATLSNGAGITVAEGKTVTFGGNKDAGLLTLDGTVGGNNIITNSGTLNLKSKVTLANAKGYGVYHKGSAFHLYEGAILTGSKTAEVYLENNSHFITLETGNPNGGNITSVELGTEKDGRDVVLQGGMTLGDGYLKKFLPLSYDKDEYDYIFKENGSDSNNEPVLELKLKETLKIEITKVDEDDHNQGLPGAEFKIVDKDGKIVQIANNNQQGTTNSNGFLSLSVRKPGTYTLVEAKAPNGYKMEGEGIYRFEVKSDGGVSTIVGEDGKFGLKDGTNDTYEITIENTIRTATVQFVKTDGSAALPGASFALYDVNPDTNPDATPIFTGTSNGNGIVAKSSTNAVVLEATKDYYLKETAVPAGYIGIGNATVTIKLTKKQNSDVNSDVWEPSITGSTLVSCSAMSGTDSYKITIINTKGVVLPSTGGKGTWIFTMAGILLMAATAAVTLGHRRKTVKRH